MMKITTRSEEETFKLGNLIGRVLEAGDIIALDGDLGAGKTHFTKGVAKGLEVSDYITSPTFTIVNQYEGRLPLYHFDVYRIDDINEMYEIGFDEYLFGNGVCVIEWADIVKELLPEKKIEIYINKVDDLNREINIDPDERFAYLKGVRL
jgi:tRNA threonylcarbamoyladenosine biosynthesis protein TsaE